MEWYRIRLHHQHWHMWSCCYCFLPLLVFALVQQWWWWWKCVHYCFISDPFLPPEWGCFFALLSHAYAWPTADTSEVTYQKNKLLLLSNLSIYLVLFFHKFISAVDRHRQGVVIGGRRILAYKPAQKNKRVCRVCTLCVTGRRVQVLLAVLLTYRSLYRHPRNRTVYTAVQLRW